MFGWSKLYTQPQFLKEYIAIMVAAILQGEQQCTLGYINLCTINNHYAEEETWTNHFQTCQTTAAESVRRLG